MTDEPRLNHFGPSFILARRSPFGGFDPLAEFADRRAVKAAFYRIQGQFPNTQYAIFDVVPRIVAEYVPLTVNPLEYDNELPVPRLSPASQATTSQAAQ